jgi:hypothetical protein
MNDEKNFPDFLKKSVKALPHHSSLITHHSFSIPQPPMGEIPSTKHQIPNI